MRRWPLGHEELDDVGPRNLQDTHAHSRGYDDDEEEDDGRRRRRER